MSTKKENAAIVGVGVAACAACCAGPILGFLAAIGLGTAVGFTMFGTIAVVIGAIVLGETLPPQTGIGGLLIIASIGLIVFRKGIFNAKTQSSQDAK